MVKESSTDLSFTGFWTQVGHSLIGKSKVMKEEPSYKQIEFLADIAASAQFTAHKQVEVKTRRALELVNKMNIPVNSLNLAGGCSGNKDLHEVMQTVSEDYKLGLVKPKKGYVQDNPASVAWMGWEYINAGLTTDIRTRNIYALNNIPLGNYIEIIQSSFKGASKLKKVGSKWQREMGESK